MASFLSIVYYALLILCLQGHIGLGIAMEVAATVVFAAIMLVGYFTGKTHRQ
jgi:hypothetical protein